MADIKAPLFDSSGAAKGDVDLDSDIFGIEPNMPVMHQVVTAQLAGARRGTASTKTRGERRGGGRKPWAQKGTGRARHGSIRSPQWRGGGIAHGPKPRDYGQRTNKKMKKLALRSALSARASESAIKVIDGFGWDEGKTKDARALLAAIGSEGKVLMVLDRSDELAIRSFANLPQVKLATPGQVTTYDVLWSNDVIFTSDTLGRAFSASYAVAADDFVKDSEGGEDA
jgi:large subunit ribosomal protein L4